jgi:hypothetical protein
MDDKEIRPFSQKLVKSKAARDIQMFWGTSCIWNIIASTWKSSKEQAIIYYCNALLLKFAPTYTKRNSVLISPSILISLLKTIRNPQPASTMPITAATPCRLEEFPLVINSDQSILRILMNLITPRILTLSVHPISIVQICWPIQSIKFRALIFRQ